MEFSARNQHIIPFQSHLYVDPDAGKFTCQLYNCRRKKYCWYSTPHTLLGPKFWKFLKSGYLGNFSNTWISGKFPKMSVNLENFLYSPNSFWNLMVVYFKNFRNFPNAQVSEKFHKCLGFWEIPQISSYLRNFQNLKTIAPQLKFLKKFGKFQEFPKCLGI